MTTLTMLSVLLMEASAIAPFHLMSIREVFPGATSEPSAQYVELQMYASGQNLVSGHTVDVYDASGALTDSFQFAANVPNGDDQATILVATAVAESYFGISADLLMSSSIPREGGMVCFGDFDCVAWGTYAGSATSPDLTGTPFNQPCGLALDLAIRRDISAGDPARLERFDDSGDSASDFAFVTPSPFNNALDGGTAPPSTKPNLLRNDVIDSIAPILPPLASVFVASSLQPLGDNDGAEPGECGLETANGSGDDDDTYITAVDPGVVDPELGLLTDSRRPLVFYQLDGLGSAATLLLTVNASGSVVFDW